jgi:hypothetical protein
MGADTVAAGEDDASSASKTSLTRVMKMVRPDGHYKPQLREQARGDRNTGCFEVIHHLMW